jgi:CubicO group peptidase (beta-lactamase class C family)
MKRSVPIMMILALIFGLVFQLTLRSQTVTDPRVDAIMNAVVKPSEPGASVIVIHNGQILHEAGYGLADLQQQKTNKPQTLYHMASTGKQFASMAIMMMKERGQLNYDDPIAVHLPELSRFGNQCHACRTHASHIRNSGLLQFLARIQPACSVSIRLPTMMMRFGYFSFGES